ncbi:MAG TPA: cytoplasmic protein [Syntrophobacteraceae bacterium]|nr:cytoplasmic protein [Syntrophobacteraceae bacterium]
MSQHHHTFVDQYDGMVAFGFSREIDEKSLMYYLQKFSEDDLTKTLVPRLSNDEINEVFELVSRLMKKHLSDAEYHQYFLKDQAPHHHHE